jgi:O-antigen/teichoic acid export membrane protein
MPGNPFRRLGIARFGAVVTITNMVNWFIDNGPHVAIGRWLGASQLGQYTVANNLVKVPADHLVRNLQSVLFPLAARAQDNDTGLRRAYLTVLGGVALVAFPTFTFIALMSDSIVLLLLGTKWAVASQVLTPLSMAMIGHAIEALCGPVLGGRGEPKLELRVKILTLVVMLAVLAFTASWSLPAVGWGVAAVYFFRWIWMNAVVMNRLRIPIVDIGRVLVGPVLLAGTCYGVTAGSDWLLDTYHATLPLPWSLLLTTAGAAVALFIVVQALPYLVLGPHVLSLLNILVTQRRGIGRIPGLRRVAAIASLHAI